jgi:beta-lactamase superfamily II metal-dependent hydrolase
MAKQPRKATLYAFNVGFGDCLLLRFEYAGGDNRHALIDFGSTAQSKANKGGMLGVANEIAALCGARGLDMLVATHRHKDHISGFDPGANGKGPGAIIARLKPKLVLQPWTEDPKAAANATDSTKAFVKALDGMHSVAAEVARFGERNARRLRTVDGERLRFVGEDNVKNPGAVKNLIKMSKAPAKAKYLKFGDRVPVGTLLPGVTLHVLGPPSLEQSDAIRTMSRTNADEYWHMRGAQAAMAIGRRGGARLFPRLATEPPVYARWVAEKAREAQAELNYAIVTALDDQMNNTSLILVFEAGGKKLLFPGDAQWENWSYALDEEEAHYDRVKKLLTGVNLYKVGHHGSLNATPKSMWTLLSKKGAASKPGRLKSMLSTMPGKHGEKDSKSEVPRRTLVAELKKMSSLQTTEGKAKPVVHEIDL